MSDEDRLRARMQDRAERVPDLADLDDVAARLGRRHPVRERRLLALVAVALVLGLGTGVLIGHRDDGRGGRSVAVGSDGSAETTQATQTTVAPTSTLPSSSNLKMCILQSKPPVTLDCSAGGEPPQTLPAPGPDQPADATAARRAVEQAWIDASDGASSNATRAAAIEGGPGLVGVFEQLQSGPYGDQVRSARTVVDDVVFLSPTRAAVKFHADLPDGSISGPYFVEAALDGANWQATRSSWCRIVSLAGAHCPE